MASEIKEEIPIDLDGEKNESFEENNQNGDENAENSEYQVKTNENHDFSDDVITIDDPNDDFSLKLEDKNPDVEEMDQKHHENDVIKVNDDFLTEVDKLFDKPINDEQDEKNEKEEKGSVPFEKLSEMELIQRMKQLVNERFLYVMKIVSATNVSKVEKFFELEELMSETWYDMGKFRKQTTKFNKNLLRTERNVSDIKVEENELIAVRLDKFKHYLKTKEEWFKTNGPRPKIQRVRTKIRQNIRSKNRNIEKPSERTETKAPQNNDKVKKEPPPVNKEVPKKNSDSLPQKEQKDKVDTKRNVRSNVRSQRSGPLKRKFDSKPKYDRYRDHPSAYDAKPKKTNPWSPIKQEPNFASSLYENAQKMVQEQLSQAFMKNVVNNVVNNVVKGMVQKLPILPASEAHFSGNQSKNRRNKADKQPSTPWLNSQRHDYSRDEISNPNPWISGPQSRPETYSATSSRALGYPRSSSYKFGSERNDMMLEPFANFSSLSGPTNSGDFGRKRDLTDRNFDRAMDDERLKRMRFEYRSDGSRYHN